MEIFGIGSRGLNLAEKMLGFVSDSTALVSSNVANSETPGYKAKSLAFEESMSKALHSGKNPDIAEGGLALTDNRHLPVTSIDSVESSVLTEKGGENIGGNTVNMETEMSKLAELDLQYSLYGDISSLEISRLRSAITLR